MKGNKYYQKKIQELRWSKEFQAQFLSRMIFDCENFCGYGCGQTNLLWAGSIERQIGYMHAIVQNIGEDIITDAQILEYENKMKDVANRMRYVHLYEVDTLITQMKVGFYSRIPEWSSDHKEISTDYAILIPYMEKDSDQMQLLSMEQIYEKLGIKNEVKKNTKVFDQIYLTSLSDRVKNAIENDKVFIDLENEQAWYVQLDNNPDDSVTPFIRGDGCYTHVFGQFRYYPKSCAKLDRKEQFQAIQRELLNKLLDMVRENLDRFVLNDSDQGQFFF